jgi:hypothetical protein
MSEMPPFRRGRRGCSHYICRSGRCGARIAIAEEEQWNEESS